MKKIQSCRISEGRMAILIVIAILLIDQVIKIWVKTNMTLHESIFIADWFRIYFIENNGMAYGMEIGSKLLLSVFRVIAVILISYYIYREVKAGACAGYIACLSMIVAGAAGNILDSMFYGLIFSASSDFYTAYLVPFGSGYAPFLMGKVVDMFYFPMIVTTWPEWMPYVGGNEFIFFSPVFNFADACISVGVVLLILFYRNEICSIRIGKKQK
ncbi:lipoprotein signal peptidase [Xylanibacter muris]|uniref:Lipoprotein signal peptidase n=1 Tax=Xylanibacter muris TaxID=2736290 RepID=A0ABX2ALY2_9BACT|nr:lipoprotein signal peptidase [Xylanibacter muris]NPD92209.1 lipoprotein signal peptidase [Xylanibacter muris]